MATKSNAERETIIRRAADEQDWDLFTEDPRILRLMNEMLGPGKPKGGGCVWRVPRSVLSFRRQRALSAEQRKMLSDRMRAMREAQK